ncbi:alpha/beta hydrolase [Micromonospora sp. NPDC050200]|uniref:alpha/beta fold hydrolase n=1 Tax=Micromonospora sp. NPDC050200 TaxID=3155664 RepID=UPI0033E22C8F
MGEIDFVNLPGLRTAYRTWGPPDARPVVALHPGSVDGATWAPLADALGDQVRLYAPDLRGYGATDRPGRYGFAPMTDDLGALLDALGLARVTLLGHSLGAVLAYRFAAAHPDRLAALVLEEPVPPVPMGFRVPPRPAGPQPFDWAAREAVLVELNDPDPAWWDRLDGISVPTLVVAGGPSSHLPQDELARMAARLPAAELVTIDAGHAVHASRPAEFHAAVSAFLSRAPA